MDNKPIADDFVLDALTYKSRWGYLDTKFIVNENNNVEVTGGRYPISGYEMPYLIPFVEEVLNLPFNKEIRPEVLPRIPKPKRNNAFIVNTSKQFPHQLMFEDEDRFRHSHGQGTADEVMKVLYLGELERVADAVFYCLLQSDLPVLIKHAIKHNVCLVPYGGGTSVSCSLTLPITEKRMIIVVDMTKLSRIIELDEENKRVTVEAGITGIHLEEQLNVHGYTLGHEPDSIEFSTVGGWVATNASGMKKNRYGNIEDLVDNYTLITPQGDIELSYGHSRMSAGVSLHKAFIGNEGNFGFITKATLKIFKKPEVKKYQSIIFPDFATGIKFLKHLQDEGTIPASIRLVDNFQFRFGRALRKKEKGLKAYVMHKLQNYIISKVKKYEFFNMVAATVMFEGSKEETEAQRKVIARLLKQYNGIFGGELNGQRGYMLTYAIAYIRDFMSDHFILGETYETTVPWNKIEEICQAVSKEAKRLHAKYRFPGTCYVSPRITQLYQTGVCIYFTHGFCYKGVTNPEDKFSELEKKLRNTIMEHGGSISHHHGIGKIRADFVDRLYTSTTKQILWSLKKNIDPNNVMGIQNNVFYKQTNKSNKTNTTIKATTKK